MVVHHLTDTLIMSAKSEHEDNVRMEILHALSNCFKESRGLMAVTEKDSVLMCCVPFLKEATPKVKAMAAKCVSQLSQSSETRFLVLHTSAIPHLLRLLDSPNSDCRFYASQALMYLVVELDGKRQMFTHRASDVLTNSLTEPNRGVLQNVLQCISTFAELPSARQQLNTESTLALIQDILDSTEVTWPITFRAASRAQAQVTWVP